MYNCPECNEPFEEGTKFCSKCGCNLEEEFMIKPICPKCKKKFPNGTKFCDVDGEKLVTPKKLIPKCVICGKEYTDGTKFCPKDGGVIITEFLKKQHDNNNYLGNINFTEKEIEIQAEIFKWLIWGSYILLIIGKILSLSDYDFRSPNILQILGIMGVASASVFYCLILYKAWSIISPEKAKTTPEKAIGYLFIPFYNFYWIFVAIQGLKEDLTALCSEKNISITPIRGSKEIPTFFILSIILFIVPYVNIGAGIALIIFQIFFIKDVKNVMISIINS